MKTVKLGDICEFDSGFAFPSKYFSSSGGVGLIRIRDIKSGRGTEIKFSGEYDRKYLVYNGDYLIGMDGEFRCYQWKGEPALLNQRVCRLREDQELLDPRYFFYGINKYLKEIEDVTVFTTVKHISVKQIKNIDFELPPLEEQRQVVEQLDAAFEKIDRAIVLTQKNLRYAESMFHRLVEQEIEELKDQPQVEMGDICKFIRGPFGGSLKKEYFKPSGYSVYEQRHAIYGDFSTVRYFVDAQKFAEMQRFEVEADDIIMSCSGTMGKTAIVPKDIAPGIINQALLKLSPNKDKLISRYVKYWMESDKFQDLLVINSGGAAIKNVASVKILKTIPIYLPSISRQQKVVDRIDKLNDQKFYLDKKYRMKLRNLNALKQSMLTQAFSGSDVE